jgi:hypothetical protein
MQVGDAVTFGKERGTILAFNTWHDGQHAFVQFAWSSAPAIPGFDRSWVRVDKLEPVV